MQETIGKITLDLTWYPGEDLYSDGNVEDELLQIAKETPEENLNAVIARRRSWPVLYHMSDVRENIIMPLHISKDDSVLEIGSGCGAVTGALAETAGSVTCIDLSRKRSLVNAWRHREYSNIQILVGNFQDIEPHLTEQYDVITLIGVFEYGKAYIGTEQETKDVPPSAGQPDPLRPYRLFLRQIVRHLKPDGRIVIAIENRLGLKYWAGCREDHSGRYFDGLENYRDGGGSARTFSAPVLKKLFEEAGLCAGEFAYPYPDYKLPLAVYSDAYPPGAGELRNNQWNFDRERVQLFDEGAVFDSLIGDGVFGMFANSFLVTLHRQPVKAPEENAPAPETPDQVVYARFSNERDPAFALDTLVTENSSGERQVVKRARTPEGNAHIDGIVRAQDLLRSLLAGTGVGVNRVTKHVTDEPRHAAVLEWITGASTLEGMAGALLHGREHGKAKEQIRALTGLVMRLATEPFAESEKFHRVFGECPEAAGEKCMPVTDVDMIAENILVTGDNCEKWTLIDYEWTFDFPVPAKYVVWRIWHYFYARYASSQIPQMILREEQITEQLASRFAQMECCYQKYVMGSRIPLRELYAAVSPGSRDLREELQGKTAGEEQNLISTLFYGKDDQFTEGGRMAVSYQPAPDGTFRVSFTLPAMENIRYVRWDPVEGTAARVELTQVVSEPLLCPEPLNGFRENGVDTFWTLDPAYILKGDPSGLRTFTVTGRIERINLSSALPQIHQIRAERDAYYNEMQNLRAWVGETKAALGYKGIEGIRRARNYVMARVQSVSFLGGDENVIRLYTQWFREHAPSEGMLQAQRLCAALGQPLLSLIVPAYRTPETYLRAMIDSVLAQTYANWELCIADGSEDGSINGVLQEYAQKDARIRVRTLDKNLGISGNTNEAAAMAGGEYLVLADHDDLLTPDALYEIAREILISGAQAVYTDEDKVNMEGTAFFDPNLKPDFSPDLLRSHNYITHLFAVQRDLFDRVGGFRPAFDGAQDYDLILRCCERANAVVHIPKVLYHWRCHPDSTAENPKSKLYAYEAGRKAVREHLERTGLRGTVTDAGYWGLSHVVYETPGDPLVSVIIPNMDHVKDLERCLHSIYSLNTYPNLEVVIVENNSTKKETFEYYRRAVRRWPRLRILRWKKAFNYAAINNFAARHASGELLLFLNNDTKLIAPESIREMAGLSLRKETGCVGAKLLFADGTVQHAGIILGPGGFAGHVFSGIGKNSPGFKMRPLVTGNYSAVTGACLMVRREVFEQAGGMSEDLAVALNDVDLCLKIEALGYRNVFTPFSLWFHYESKSRGYETTPEKKARFDREVALFRERWGEKVDQGDPYYNRNFDPAKPPFQWW